MKKIIKFWNENRLAIIIVIIVIVFLLALIYVTNSIFAQMNANNQSQTGSVNNNDNINGITGPAESLVTGEEIPVEQVSKIDTLNQFISLCSENKVEEAYALLSDECKEQLYPTIDNFRQNYFNKTFAGQKKNVSVENWVSNTYRIRVTDDFLSTGMYTTENAVQDYITIVKAETGENKLNINSFIEREEINKTANINNIEITVLDTNIYMNYQEFKIKVTNNTDKQILLDDNLVEDSSYIEDRNELKYAAYMHELAEAQLIVPQNQTKEVSIKFYTTYSSSRTIAKIGFSRIVTNYGANEPANYASIEIEL